jgi:hypothetical protein
MGMLIELSYCAEVNAGLPCRNIIGCWEGRMDISSFLQEHFSRDQLQQIFCSLPKSRIDRIIEAMHE